MRILLVMLTIAAAGCITGNVIHEIPHEGHFNYTLLFCGDCIHELMHLINNSREISCALYSADKGIFEALERKNASVVVDKDARTYGTYAIRRNSSGLMHNKFCVFDSQIVWTGSYNPVKRNSRDNVVIINSTLLAANYLDELEELKTNRSSRTTAAKILLNATPIENYFCPEDECIEQLLRQLNQANSSIVFATYSFTSTAIANELILKNMSGVAVTGIMENGGKYSQLETLQRNGINVEAYTGKGVLHHKFFIVDNSTVITGSFNPTINGNTRNDENIIVIRNVELAKEYIDYFGKLT